MWWVPEDVQTWWSPDPSCRCITLFCSHFTRRVWRNAWRSLRRTWVGWRDWTSPTRPLTTQWLQRRAGPSRAGAETRSTQTTTFRGRCTCECFEIWWSTGYGFSSSSYRHQTDEDGQASINTHEFTRFRYKETATRCFCLFVSFRLFTFSSL